MITRIHGSQAFIADASSTTSHTTDIGGGGSRVLAFSYRTDWIIH